MFIMDFGVVVKDDYGDRISYFTLSDKVSVHRMIDAVKNIEPLHIVRLSDDFIGKYVRCRKIQELMEYYEESFRPESKTFTMLDDTGKILDIVGEIPRRQAKNCMIVG